MNQFILADPEKCIGCRTCEVACMMSHQSSATPVAFTSRIRVVKGGTFTTAVGCHQCEDAPCANVCPTGAIHHAAGA
ncbi:4Fe-4S binding protein, partial [Enterobacter hormaechei]